MGRAIHFHVHFRSDTTLLFAANLVINSSKKTEIKQVGTKK